jgi:hypothetical protein
MSAMSLGSLAVVQRRLAVSARQAQSAARAVLRKLAAAPVRAGQAAAVRPLRTLEMTASQMHPVLSWTELVPMSRLLG